MGDIGRYIFTETQGPDPEATADGHPRPMLTEPTQDVVECLQHAAACELQANRTNDQAAQRSFFDLAARWRRIAETYKYIERVDNFIAKRKPEPEKSLWKSSNGAY